MINSLPTGEANSYSSAWSPAMIFRCLCIAGNALTALGLFTFPIIAPSLARNLQLTQPQLSTIVLAGMVGQYPLASVVGELVDRVGTWAASLCACILFALGYGLFVWTIDQHVTLEGPLPNTSYYILVGCFFLLGLGGVNSHFSAIFSAAKQFPRHIGFATGVALALFGLSPLFLSLPSVWFLDVTGTVDARNYVIFLGIISCTMTLISTFGLRGIPLHEILPEETGGSMEGTPDERTPLVPKSLEPERSQSGQGWLTLLTDSSFWWLWLALLLGAGSAEMVMGNIGTVMLTLPALPLSANIGRHSVSNQVRITSLCNTLIRFIVGSAIDVLSPNPLLPQRPKSVSRIAFLSGACLLLSLVYGFVATFMTAQTQVWVLSAGAGIAYGTIWTVLPSIVKIVWGEANVARNFGLMSYAPFFGTPLWSYLFAFGVEQEAQDKKEHCSGPGCWRLTFRIASAVMLATAVGLIPLWKRLKQRV